MVKLTNAQVFTLRRINMGESAQINTHPKISGRWFKLAMNCPSLPKLYALGLVERVGYPVAREIGKYHRVQLTKEGKQALIDYSEVKP